MKAVIDFMKNVLWTGGWDSTFRVLELVIMKKEMVQPHYILDEDRASTQKELHAYDLDLCIEYDSRPKIDHPVIWLADIIQSSELQIDEKSDSYYALALDKMPYPELRIFQYFHFPTLWLTKIQMGEIALEHGFDDIMEHTWFCHNPRKNGSPCGMCTPCRLTRSLGLGRRVPNPSLIQLMGHYSKRVIKRIKNFTVTEDMGDQSFSI